MRERLVDDMLAGGTSVVVCWAQACADRAAGLEVNFQKSETIVSAVSTPLFASG
ncbi:MAG TPA: hypothetical protein VFE34_04745 [Dongiaceae bacterium]|jgi:hypothetical protein|nr:hypothetical protein [Dongiaceae bacterium]